VTLAFLFSSAASAAIDSHVEAAYRSSRGELIALVANGSGKGIFWGNLAELHQLEVLGQAPAASDTTIAFYRGLNNGKERSGEIEVDPTGVRIQCDPRDGTEAFAPLSRSGLAALAMSIREGKTKVSAPKELLEPLYLFEAGKELVLVMGPVFNFRGDFRVLMGQSGHLRPIAVDHSPARVSEAEQGHIRFARGGGLFIPLTIDLSGHQGNRGTPALIRADGAPMEALSMPHLSRAEIERLGFGRPIHAPLYNPCDRGQLVQVGPRSL
jgi:hypothetical protein